MPIRFQVDPDFYDHPKTIGMSDSATALWVRAGSYSAAKLTDGFVAEHVVRLLSTVPDEATSELLGRGLWRRVKGGFRFHQWDRRNLTRARVEADKEADRKRKQEARKSAGQNANGQHDPGIVRPESEPESDRNPDGVRPLSVSVSVSESVSVSGRGSRTAVKSPPQRPPEPPTRCPEHEHDLDPPRCGACANARKAHDAWQRALGDWEKAMGEWDRTAPRCRRHPTERAHNCRTCAGERKAAA
jgi:hypothetical protein